MLDPALVRDHIDDVRAGLRNRGLDADADARRSSPTLETRAPRADSRGRGTRSASRTRRATRSRAPSAQGHDPSAIFAANKARGAADQAARGRSSTRSSSSARALLMTLPESAARERAGRHERRRQRGSAARTASRARSTSSRKPHWDLGPALGILDFERATQDVRRAVLRAAAAPARGSRARSSTSCSTCTRASTATREVEPPFLVNADALRGTGNLPKFEQDLFKIAGDWDLYLDPDRRSAADEPASRRDPRRPRSCRSATPPTRRASAARPARTAPTCAG